MIVSSGVVAVVVLDGGESGWPPANVSVAGWIMCNQETNFSSPTEPSL
jgi:hypothetical protein